MKHLSEFLNELPPSFSDSDFAKGVSESVASLASRYGFSIVKTPKTLDQFLDIVRENYDMSYSDDGKWAFKAYNKQLAIIDTSNALMTGKSCKVYTLDYWDDMTAPFNAFDRSMTFQKFVDAIGSNSINELASDEYKGIFKTYTRDQKGIATFNPLAMARLKRVKSLPSKPTISHVIKLIANGQFSYLGRNYKYTDDYAYDAAMDHGKIENADPISLVQKMVEGKWNKPYTDKTEGGEMIIRFGPHSAESWTLVVDLKKKLRIRV